MALTPEIIKANEQLSGLSEEQVAAISTLSVNDENNVINSKVGEIHGAYDKDVLEVSGVEKNQGEKTYDYVKRVLGDFKTKISGSTNLQTEVENYKTQITELQAKIANGQGNEVLTQQLADANNKFTELQNQYATDKQNWETKESEFNQKITGIHINSEFNKATAGIKFKAGYPEGVQQTLIKSAQETITSKYTPDWVEADGERIMVFRDQQGNIALNKNNSLNPYTAKELINEQLKEVIDTGKQTNGAGTGDPGQGDGKVEIVDIAGAKNQVQANDMIVKYLMQNGVTRGTQEFADRQKKIIEDNGVMKLPIR